MAGVAQLVEHRTVDAAVAGSSPVARPIKKPVRRPVFLLSALPEIKGPNPGIDPFLRIQPS